MVLGVVKGGVRVCQGGSQESGDATNKPYVAVLHRPLTIQPWTFRVDWLGRQKKRGGCGGGGCGGGGERGWGWLPTWWWLSRMIEIWGASVQDSHYKLENLIRDLKISNDLYSNKFSHPPEPGG